MADTIPEPAGTGCQFRCPAIPVFAAGHPDAAKISGNYFTLIPRRGRFVYLQQINYVYRNPDNPGIEIVVAVPKKESPIKSLLKKKKRPATITKLSTRADAEKNKEQSVENRKQKLIDRFRKNIQDTERSTSRETRFTM